MTVSTASGAGPQKRVRRRLVGGASEEELSNSSNSSSSAVGTVAEEDERDSGDDAGHDKLPLESEALLRQLICQQQGSLHRYRREVAALEQQKQQQCKAAEAAAKQQQQLQQVWGDLQSDLLLLKARLTPLLDKTLLEKLLQRPESSFIAPSVFGDSSRNNTVCTSGLQKTQSAAAAASGRDGQSGGLRKVTSASSNVPSISSSNSSIVATTSTTTTSSPIAASAKTGGAWVEKEGGDLEAELLRSSGGSRSSSGSDDSSSSSSSEEEEEGVSDLNSSRTESGKNGPVKRVSFAEKLLQQRAWTKQLMQELVTILESNFSKQKSACKGFNEDPNISSTKEEGVNDKQYLRNNCASSDAGREDKEDDAGLVLASVASTEKANPVKKEERSFPSQQGQEQQAQKPQQNVGLVMVADAKSPKSQKIASDCAAASAESLPDEDGEGGTKWLSQQHLMDSLRSALLRLRGRAQVYRHRMRREKKKAKALSKQVLSFTVENDRLLKQITLLRYRLQLLTGGKSAELGVPSPGFLQLDAATTTTTTTPTAAGNAASAGLGSSGLLRLSTTPTSATTTRPGPDDSLCSTGSRVVATTSTPATTTTAASTASSTTGSVFGGGSPAASGASFSSTAVGDSKDSVVTHPATTGAKLTPPTTAAKQSFASSPTAATVASAGSISPLLPSTSSGTNAAAGSNVQVVGGKKACLTTPSLTTTTTAASALSSSTGAVSSSTAAAAIVQNCATSAEGLLLLRGGAVGCEDLVILVETLEEKIKLRDREIADLREQRNQLEKTANEVKLLRSLSQELILHSVPYLELQQDAEKLEEALVVRTAEIEELRYELLHEQQHKDVHFEKLLTSARAQAEETAKKVKELTQEAATVRLEREKLLAELDTTKKELQTLRVTQEEQETVFRQRNVQLNKLKIQHEQLKNASAQMLQRNERMRKEKQQLIEAVRQKEESLQKLQLCVFSAEKQIETGMINISNHSSSGACSDVSANQRSASCAVGEDSKNVAAENKDLISASDKTKAASTAAEVVTTSTTSSSIKTEKSGEVEAPLLPVKHTDNASTSLELENEALRRKLSDYDQLDAEMGMLREQYTRVSEEVDEISKAFEERQTYCEHLLRQLKERDEALVELRSRSCNFLQQQQMLQRVVHLYKQKMLLLRQQYEQGNSNCRAYAEALHQANGRAALADQQRDELALWNQQTHAVREALHREKEEALSQLAGALEANQGLDNVARESLLRRNMLENELRKLSDEKIDLEKRFEKNKEKTERKRAHTQALQDISDRDVQLMEEENETMRRRLLCSICNERFKDHMINKCGHMYCFVCLERNVKTRNRKCPQCKAQFDQKDIRRIYLDN